MAELADAHGSGPVSYTHLFEEITLIGKIALVLSVETIVELESGAGAAADGADYRAGAFLLVVFRKAQGADLIPDRRADGADFFFVRDDSADESVIEIERAHFDGFSRLRPAILIEKYFRAASRCV